MEFARRGSGRLLLEEFPLNLIFWDFHKNLSTNPKLYYIWAETLGTLYEDLSQYVSLLLLAICNRHKSALFE